MFVHFFQKSVSHAEGQLVSKDACTRRRSHKHSSPCQKVYFILQLLGQHADVVHPMAEVHLKHGQCYHSHLEINDNETCSMANILILYTKDRRAKFGACFNILPFFDKDCYHHPFSMRGRSSGFRETCPDLPL